MMNRESGKSRRYAIQGIKKADIILIAVCLLAAAILGMFFIFHRKAGSTARILCDGSELTEIVLDSPQTDSGMETERVYYLITFRDDDVGVEYFHDKPKVKFSEGTSYNLISMMNGEVVMEEADCADQICVHHKPISSTHESIICLPHRLVIEIAGSENAAVNAEDGKQDGNSNDMPGESLDGVAR